MISERFLLQQFLTGQELGHHHSSHFLNMTQQLMGVRVTVTNSWPLRELFLQRLAHPICILHAAVGNRSLDRLVALLHRVEKCPCLSIGSVSASAQESATAIGLQRQ